MPLSRIYIYNSGDGGDRWDEGPGGEIFGTGTEHYFTLTKAATQLKIDGSGVGDVYTSFVSGPYNMNYYDSVSINWSYGASNDGLGSTAIFALDPSGDTPYNDYQVKVEHILGSPSTTGDTVDVTSLSGEYYIYIVLETNGKPSSTYAYTDQVYFSGDVPLASSTTNLGDCVCMGNIGLDEFTGSGNMTLGPCSASSVAGVGNYGFLDEALSYTLEGLSYELTGYTSINGSGAGTLGGLNIAAYGGPSSNYGATSTSLSTLGINSSGGNFSTAYAFMNATFDSIGTTSSGTTSGISKYSVEWKRFSGRSCITLDKEYSASTTDPTGDCFSMLKPLALSLKSDYGPLTYVECGCSINIPIYLNRSAHEDVELSLTTSQPSANIDYSGVVVPALSGIDYVHNSGLYTIPSGSDYVNFPVTLIDNSSVVSNYFNVNVLYAKTRNICQNSAYTINIILGTG